MHDRLDHDRLKDDAALAAALRALPAGAPPHDAWPALAARIKRRQRARRAAWLAVPAALAAGVALFLLQPHFPRTPQQTRSTPIAATAIPTHAAVRRQAPPDLAALQARSAQWQAWVQDLDRNGTPLDGQSLSAAISLQDRIGLVDLQLSAAHMPATRAALWQQRIALLQQLGLLHLQPYLVARAMPSRDATSIVL